MKKERNQFLKFLDENDIKNIVFITTDVHFAGTVNVTQDFDGDGNTYTFYELINGPLTTSTRDTTNPVDPTINANIFTMKVLSLISEISKLRKMKMTIRFIFYII
jgi:phosphodiesterase/alkaline phosphatase D-like protein